MLEGKQRAPAGTWVMGTPVVPQPHPANQQSATWVAVDYTSNATANPNYANYSSSAPPHLDSSSSSSGNPYVQVAPVAGSPEKGPMDTILKVLNRCGQKFEDTARRVVDSAGNVWHHLKTSPSVTDAAMARLAQGTKVIAEGGNDKVFQQIFGIFPGEQLRKAYACYLSTSSGPVIGTLYLSTARLAFCSDNPLCHNISEGQQEWIYYKVVIPLVQLRAVNPSANVRNPTEKYIQIVTTDNQEFWFMGFVSYDKALKNLRDALQHFDAHRFHSYS